MNKKYLFMFALILFSSFEASALDFREQYQDYTGTWYKYTNENLSAHPFYSQSQNSTHYLITRMDDILNINKNLIWNGSFDFKERDISFTILAPASKVQNISVANGTGQRRIRIPESVKPIAKYLEWDGKLPAVELRNSTWNMTVIQSDYWYSRQSGNLWLNFKTANVTGLPGDVITYFNFTTWSVTNATTQGWSSANVTLNGLAFCGDGKLGLNYNASYLNGLVAAYCMRETQGTIVHNVNTESGLINTTNRGTWYGGALNSTGDGILFNGVSNYINAGNDVSLNLSQSFTVSAWINPNNISSISNIINKESSIQLFAVNPSTGRAYFYLLGLSNPSWTFLTGKNLLKWTHVVGTYNYSGTNNLNYYVDGSRVSQITVTGNITAAQLDILYIGSRSTTLSLFNGSINKVRIWNRALSADEIAEDYNRSFRTYGSLNILNQTASAGNVINRSRITAYNLTAIENITGYSRQNTTSIWALFQSLMGNYTWYDISAGNQYNNMDANFSVQSSGNLSPYLSEIEFDETLYLTTAPTNLQNTTGNFWIRHSWLGNAQSYNVSVNGTWYNGTINLFYNNSGLLPHGWSNISVAGFNSTGGTSNLSASISQNTQIPNNVPIPKITLHTTYLVDTGTTLNFTINSTDLDNDALSYSSNNTIGIFNTSTGNFTYTGIDSDAGSYTFYFTVDDGHGGIVTQITTITEQSTTQMLLAALANLPTKDDVTNAGATGFIGGILGGMITISILKRYMR